jgi:P4 family phage/plasmid primase-like protien
MTGLSVADIAARLNARIADLARALLGEPNHALSTATQMRFGTKGSVAVEIDGPDAGKWFDHEVGVGGDGLELIRHRHGVANGEACEWARQWLGLPTDRPINTTKPRKDATDKAAKVAGIVADCRDPHGTCVETYLRNRAITAAPLPACIRYLINAYGHYGALVALATDTEGQVHGLQLIYLTEDGRKAPLKVQKRTNKAHDGWSDVAAVRLPGSTPLVVCEGVETALSIWQATGRETWACLGIANIFRAPVPEGVPVIIARDGDEPGTKADRQIGTATTRLVQRGHAAAVATPPLGKDFNDVLVEHGNDAVRNLIDGAVSIADHAPPTHKARLDIGSDVEIAGRVREDLTERFGRIVHAEGAFWRYEKTNWEDIPEHELRLATHRYDGAEFLSPAGEPACVKLGRSRIDSILHECGTLCAEPKFFEWRPIGINCASGFIRVAQAGTATIEPHHPDHRCRHTLPGHWQTGASSQPPSDSLLFQLLDGIFRGDAEAADKVVLLSEICGSAALGYATQLIQPRAIILVGQRAENGKSQVLDLARGLLPPNAICSVPAGRMGDERHIIGLIGKLLNATDELSATAIASDTFKSVVTGEPVQGRDVYKSRVEFRSVAQNLFATNNLPPFQGGMDRGVQRRLLVIPFNRLIPIEERVENIGKRITQEEADLLLAWAVEGASRLIRQRNFTIPASCKQALADWIFGADPVLAWLDECVEVKPIVNGYPNLATRGAYDEFRAWAVAEGFKHDKLPAINGFVQRVQANANGVEHRRNKNGRQFLGLTIVRHAPPASVW